MRAGSFIPFPSISTYRCRRSGGKKLWSLCFSLAWHCSHWSRSETGEAPMQQRKRALSAYLTRQEWQLCFALSFAHQLLSEAGPFDSFAEELRYAIRYLAENGMEFEAVRATIDGRIVPTQE